MVDTPSLSDRFALTSEIVARDQPSYSCMGSEDTLNRPGAFPQFLIEHEELQEWDIFAVGYSSNLRIELTRFWAADAPLDVLAYYLRTMLTLPPLDTYQGIALVTHSMGGLIAQHALLDGCQHNVQSVFHARCYRPHGWR